MSTQRGVMEVVALVGSHLSSVGDVRAPSLARLLSEIGRFALSMEARSIDSLALVSPRDCSDFISQAVVTRSGEWADPSVSTRYVRRSAIRLLYGTARRLQLVDGDPTLDIRLPPRGPLTTRALDDGEEALGASGRAQH